MWIDHRYEVLRELGVGGMGAVYLVADHRAAGRHVALKSIADRRAARSLGREFELLVRLRHPNLAEVYDFGRDSDTGHHYFTAEFIDGAPFDWHGTGQSFEWLVERTVELLRALDRVHREGLLHCDVKPENALVVRSSGVVKLLDFGLAMAAPAASVPPRGTLPFMAPEWLRGAAPDRRADLYGLGMLLYRATFGVYPFRSMAQQDVLSFHLETPAAVPPGRFDVPAWWPPFVLRLLTKNPAERYATAREALRAINVHSEHVDGAYTLETDSSWAERLCGGRFIGRERTTAALDEILARTTRAAGPAASTAAPSLAGDEETVLVVLEGVPGVGKTRLLTDTLRALQLQRVPVLLEEARGDTTVERLTASLRYLLGPEHPAWRQADGAAPAERRAIALLSANDGDDAHHRLISEVGDLLLAAARERPLVLLIDQAEQMDALTTATVSYVLHAIDYTVRCLPGGAPRGERPRLVIVLAARAPGPERLAALAAHPLARRLELAPLDTAAVPALVATLLGVDAAPPDLVREVVSVCGGNPGFIQAFLSLLLQRGALAVRDGELVFSGEQLRDQAGGGKPELPRTMEESLARLVSDLPEAERELLAYLALAVEPCSSELLAAASEWTVANVRDVSRALLDRGLARSVEVHGGLRLAPAGQVFADVVCAGLSEEDRRSRNARFLKALCARPAERPSAAALAQHLERAGRLEEGFAVALSAAREARQRGSFDRAECEIERARRMLPPHPLRLLALAAEEALLASLAGDGARAQRVIEDALEGGREELDGRARAVWLQRLAAAQLDEGAHDSAERALAEALDGLDADDAMARGAVLALWGRVLFFAGDFAASESRAAEALQACAMVAALRPLTDTAAAVPDSCMPSAGFATVAHAHATLGLVEAYHGTPTRGLDHLKLATELYRVCGERRELVFAENALGLVYHRMGERERAILHYEASLALACALGDQRRETKARMNLSVAHQEAGQYQQAIERYMASQERAYRLQDHDGLMRIANNLANIFRFLGRLAEAELWLQRSLVEAERLQSALMLGYNRLIQGEVHLLRGEWEPAWKRLSEAEERLRQLERKDVWLEARLDQADWLLQTGRHDEAATVAREVVAEAAGAGLADHGTRGLLMRAAATLAGLENAAPSDPAERRARAARALTWGLAAHTEVATKDMPELQWRVHATLARAYATLAQLAPAAPEGESSGEVGQWTLAARHALERATVARAELEAGIPAEMRSTFFERRDRRAHLDERLDEHGPERSCSRQDPWGRRWRPRRCCPPATRSCACSKSTSG
jgi:tetratricopeptide (TPR) repeat protein